jgi:hypothetical protein
MLRPSKKYPSRVTVPLTSSKLKHNYLFRRCVCLAGQHGQTSVCLQVREDIFFYSNLFFLSFNWRTFWYDVPMEVLYIIARGTSPLSSALPSSSKSFQKVNGRESNWESFEQSRLPLSYSIFWMCIEELFCLDATL